MLKRTFDFLAALAGLVLLSPLLLLTALCLKLDSRGPVFHRGPRVGMAGRPFLILKFRSMVVNADQMGPAVTKGGDPRITRVGRLLRKTKIDELPQLINVLVGDMSLVGPRPEDPRHVAHYTAEQRRVLDLRPGVTSLTSVLYRDEESILAGLAPEEVERVYLSEVMPAKLRIDLEYVDKGGFWKDLKVLALTAVALFRAGRPAGHGGR